ncbi:unnamed protein product [Schistosoma mattheei]|uniref:Uncharacterized protein n=1 Tax=Schistosoma mattheei TaxID=31246 RepID=A0A183PJU7_9TREM|nr:unnamed protein product [Schistosoma mattheei]
MVSSHCLAENCMLPPNTNTEAVFLKPRAPFKLAAFNVRSLMQVRQQIGLPVSLESFNIDVCCLSETRIQDSGEVLQIRSPSVASKSLFYVHLSRDPVASSSGLAGVGVTLSVVVYKTAAPFGVPLWTPTIPWSAPISP